MIIEFACPLKKLKIRRIEIIKTKIKGTEGIFHLSEESFYQLLTNPL